MDHPSMVKITGFAIIFLDTKLGEKCLFIYHQRKHPKLGLDFGCFDSTSTSSLRSARLPR